MSGGAHVVTKALEKSFVPLLAGAMLPASYGRLDKQLRDLILLGETYWRFEVSRGIGVRDGL